MITNNLCKSVFGLIFCFVCFSCVEDVSFETRGKTEVKISSDKRTVEEAFSIAETVANGSKNDSRAANKQVDKANVSYITGMTSRSGDGGFRDFCAVGRGLADCPAGAGVSGICGGGTGERVCGRRLRRV